MRDDAPRWRRYLRFWRSNIAADVDEEFRFHLEERVDHLIATGMPAKDAREKAQREFGDMDSIKRTCQTLAQERESGMRRIESLHVLKQDTVYALRLMKASPTFTAAIVLTVALGIGATTAIFSVVNSVLLRPLPYANADRVLYMAERFGENRGSVSAGHFHDWTEQSTTLAATGAAQGATYIINDGEATRSPGSRVTPGFFKVLHITPALGRYFLDSETADSRVVVLSHGMWQSRYQGDSTVIGKPIVLNGEAHTIVGVTPAAMDMYQQQPRLYTVLSVTPQQRNNYGAHSWQVFGLMKPGVSVEQARADIERVTEGIRQRHPDNMKDRGVSIELMRDVMVETLDTQLYVLLGAVTFVLLIGCGNVASLLLARALTRRKEIAIRAALGSGRRRLVRQLLTESVLLSVVGGVLGLVVALFGMRFLVSQGPTFIPRIAETRLDGSVLAFAAASTLLCGLFFGLLPALRATSMDLQRELREGGRGSRGAVRDRLRSALIVSEIAVALVLLVSAGLFLRSAQRLQAIDPGFDPSGVTTMRIALPPDRYDSASKINRAFLDVVADVRAIPGVRFAGAGSRVPMWGPNTDVGIRVDGKPPREGNGSQGHLRLITPGYLEAIGIPLRKGRLLAEGDIQPGAARVVLINETFARNFFGDENPIGQRISGWASDQDREWREIIGVIGDVRAFSREVDVPPEFYVPVTQASQSWWNGLGRNMTVVAKAASDAPLGTAMRAALRRVDPTLPSWDIQTMDDVMQQSTATRRFNTMLLTLLGVTGLVLAAIGIYGVIAFFVTQRTHEISVRVALGATTPSVIMLVVRQAFVMALAGIVLGGVAAVWATKALESMLFQVNARDPMAFGAGAIVLLAVAVGASLIPARRAARVEPLQALNSSG